MATNPVRSHTAGWTNGCRKGWGGAPATTGARRFARRTGAVALLGAAFALVVMASPAGAKPERKPIGPISVSPLAGAPVGAMHGLGRAATVVPVVLPVVAAPQLVRTEAAAAAASSTRPALTAATSTPVTPRTRTDAGGGQTATPGTDPSSSPVTVTVSRELEAPDVETAVLRLARSSTALFVLLGAAIFFLLAHRRLDRRSPMLAAAPRDRREDVLEFP